MLKTLEMVVLTKCLLIYVLCNTIFVLNKLKNECELL